MKSPGPYCPATLWRIATQRIAPTATEMISWLIGVPSASAADCLADTERRRSDAARSRWLS